MKLLPVTGEAVPVADPQQRLPGSAMLVPSGTELPECVLADVIACRTIFCLPVIFPDQSWDIFRLPDFAHRSLWLSLVGLIEVIFAKLFGASPSLQNCFVWHFVRPTI